MEVNFLSLREVQLKGLEGRLIYANGLILGISFENEEEKLEFLRVIDEYTQNLLDRFEYVN